MQWEGATGRGQAPSLGNEGRMQKNEWNRDRGKRWRCLDKGNFTMEGNNCLYAMNKRKVLKKAVCLRRNEWECIVCASGA